MTLDDKLALATKLMAQRESIDAQLETLFGGQVSEKRQQKCRLCGEPGHRSDTCPSKERGLPENQQALNGGAP